MDKILIRNLRLQGIIGTTPEERLAKQTVLLNITLDTDTRPAAAGDDLTATVDYHALILRVQEYVEASSHLLVETLANALAELILTEFQVTRVILRLEKPDVLPQTEAVGVEIERPVPA
jgi:7,8-dihydroneopterin aldolase/epimerase/oxygenase